MKKNQLIEKYRIIDETPIFDSPNSTLYLAESIEEGATNFKYVVKKYNKTGIREREGRIANNINNNTRYSIVVGEALFTREVNGIEYSVSKYHNDGMFLSQLLEMDIPLLKQIELLKKILKSVKHLHERVMVDDEHCGYIHTDLHPGNIFVESVSREGDELEFGEVKFIDFSNALPLSKITKTATKESEMQLGGVMGFCPYELLDQSRNEISPSVDLYAVAAIGAQMYTGIKKAQRWDDVIGCKWSEREKHTIIDYLFYRFLKCGLEYNPIYRFQSAEEMEEAVINIGKMVNSMNSYYELFELAYDMGVSIDKCTFENLDINAENFKESVDKLDRALTQNQIEKHKCNYIFEAMWTLKDFFDDKDIKNEEKCRLISCGIASNNHLANTKRAFELIEAAKKYENLVSSITKATLNNRKLNAYGDFFEYDSAYDIIMENIQKLEARKVLEAPDYKLKELARAYSAAGSYEVYKNWDKAMMWFEKALNEFDNKEEEGNKEITYSHILHYTYLKKDKNSKELYYHYIDKYMWNGSTLCSPEERQQKFVEKYKETKEQGKSLDQYKTYAYLKGVYVFEADIAKEENFLDVLKEIVYEEYNVKPQHPQQLICKYIALILKKCDVEGKYAKVIEDAKRKSLMLLENGRIDVTHPLNNILMVSSYQNQWEYNEMTGKQRENIELFEQLLNHPGVEDWCVLYKELKRREKEKEGLKNLLIYENI